MTFFKLGFVLLFLSNFSKLSAQIIDHTSKEAHYKGYTFSAIETLISMGSSIDSVVIIGNVTLKSYILIKQSLLKKNDTLTLSKLQTAHERLINLQLFNFVAISANQIQATAQNSRASDHFKPILKEIYESLIQKAMLMRKTLTVVAITVEEAKNIYFSPKFKLIGTNITRWFSNPNTQEISIGAGYLHKNITGHADILEYSFTCGNDFNMDIFYFYPYLFEQNFIGIGFSIQYSNEQNLSLSVPGTLERGHFKYSAISIQSFLKLYISENSYLSTALKMSKIDVHPAIKTRIPNSIFSSESFTYFPTLAISFSTESIDFKQHPMRGYYFKCSISQFGLPWKNDEINLTKFFSEAAYHLPLLEDALTFSSRYIAHISVTNSPSPKHERVFFGYTNIVRGYYSKIYEGDNFILFSTEIRYAILPITFFPNSSNFLFQSQTFILGCYLSLFLDAGNIWYNHATAEKESNIPYPSTSLNFSNWKYGYGFGITLVTIHNMTFRLDFSLNTKTEFDLGISNSVSF